MWGKKLKSKLEKNYFHLRSGSRFKLKEKKKKRYRAIFKVQLGGKVGIVSPIEEATRESDRGLVVFQRFISVNSASE